MANVWVGENYYITNIYVTDSSYFDDTKTGDAANVTANAYLTILQRLPESSFPSVTEVAFDTARDSITLGLGDDDLVTALLPKINDALAADDASDKSETHSPTALDNYSVKI